MESSHIRHGRPAFGVNTNGNSLNKGKLLLNAIARMGAKEYILENL